MSLCSYSGNINLHKGSTSANRINIVVGSSVGAAGLLIATIVSFIFMRKGNKRHPEKGMNHEQGKTLEFFF